MSITGNIAWVGTAKYQKSVDNKHTSQFNWVNDRPIPHTYSSLQSIDLAQRQS